MIAQGVHCAELPDAVRKAVDSVVLLQIPGERCSGVISANSKILTDYHCVKDNDITGSQARQEDGAFADILLDGFDAFHDVAKFRMPKGHSGSHAWAPIDRRSAPARQGEVVYVIGKRTGISQGRIRLASDKSPFFTIAASDIRKPMCWQGDSGGAIVDLNGKLLGIISGRMSGFDWSADCLAVGGSVITAIESGAPEPGSYRIKPTDWKVALLLADRASLHTASEAYAQRLFRQAVQLSRRSEVYPLVEACDFQSLASDYSRDVSYCDDALKRDPNNTRALVAKAVLFSVQGKVDESLPLIDKALLIEPNRLDYWVKKAGILNKANMPREAELAAKNAEGKIDHDDPLLIDYYRVLVDAANEMEDLRTSWMLVKRARKDGVELPEKTLAWMRQKMPEPAD